MIERSLELLRSVWSSYERRNWGTKEGEAGVQSKEMAEQPCKNGEAALALLMSVAAAAAAIKQNDLN